MKKLFLALFCFATLSVSAQLKKDGTPDMRFSSNKSTYSNTYSTPSYTPSTYPSTKVKRSYNNGGQIRLQNGYTRSNGTYVAPHTKTKADNNTWNNKSNW